jgi:hypothetical protein
VGARGVLGSVVRVVTGVAVETEGPRECLGGRIPESRGAVVGRVRVFEGTGVTGGGNLFLTRAATDLSDSGGEGGVVCTVDVSDLVGGVDTDGDDVVVADVEVSETGDGGRISVEIGVTFRALSRSRVCSEWRSFPWIISSSIFRSVSSSLRCWLSILKFSRSCSPFLTSSSNRTPLSMATLYLDSRSSRDEV